MVGCLSAAAGWDYESDTDKMTGKSSSRADVTSSNKLDFDFPYKGENTGNLTIRKHPRYGQQVILSITKGQMLCNSYDCAVLIKFDNEQPRRYPGTGPADHNTTTIFIGNEPQFIANVKKAKTIFIQFNAYHNGSPILEFSTPQPLEWPRK